MQEEIKVLSQPEIEGLLLVDKPSGMTSHNAVSWARKITGVRKIGHTGTLDPLATGLLILLIGRNYTKIQHQFLKQNKSYLCTAQLGVTTDSYDLDGKVTAAAEWDKLAKISEIDVKNALVDFEGKINQTVPAFSAVKTGGRKLYELARKGKIDEIELPVKEVEIFQLKLLSFERNEKQKQIYFSIDVSCSSGTYIRSLVHDIGQKLSVGASVTQLRRTRIGDFHLENAVICPLKKSPRVGN